MAIKAFCIFVLRKQGLMAGIPEVSDVHLYSANQLFYDALIADIENAKKNIHIEIYRFTKDETGQRVRDALIRAAKRKVHVKLLLDAWGTGSSLSFFSDIIQNGGQVRVFNTLRLGTRLFTQSHRRNHRKIIVVDDNICYIGSANISGYSLQWRELTLRIVGSLAKPFRYIIEFDFKTHQKYIYTKKVFSRTIHFRGFEIIRDVPSIYKQKVMRKLLYLIKNAQHDVYIETPYFLPGYRLRKAMADAVERGVTVNVVMPRHSDVSLVDVLRNRYLGLIHRTGVNIFFYYPNNLHSKLMLVDNKIFAVGSTNFDYRSFRYMHEIMLVGKHPDILQKLLHHREITQQSVELFDFERWKNRPLIEKVISWMLVPFRYMF